MAKKSLILFILVFILAASTGEELTSPYSRDKMVEFVDYLYSLEELERCVTEGLRTAVLFPETADTIYPKVVKSYFRLNEYKKVVSLIDKIGLAYKDSLAYALLKNKDYGRLISMDPENDFQLEMVMAGMLVIDDMEGFRMRMDLIDPDNSTKNQKRLMKVFAERLEFKTKSPATAGILSALIPGLGRIYAGRLADGLFSMAYISLLTYKVYYTFDKRGIGNVEPWIWAAMDMYFYLGNIYGSVVAAKIRTRDMLLRMENEIQLSINITF